MSALYEKIQMRIRQLREGKGWFQADLARKSGVTQAYISQLEAGL